MNCSNKHKKKEFYTSNEFPKMQILEKFYKNILEEFTRNLKESGEEIPGVVSALFSWLKPNTEICEHQGYENYAEKILRYHLGLIIPKGEVALKCNNVIKYWQNGKSFIFDDSLIHGAWNKSNFDRYVLIVDFVKNDNETVSELKDVILTSEAQYFYEKYNKGVNEKSD